MKDNRLKEQVMKDIREAMMDRNVVPDSDTFPSSAEQLPMGDDLSVVFARNFTASGGVMYYCYSEDNIRDRMTDICLKHGNVAIGCTTENLTGFLKHLEIGDCTTCVPGQTYTLGATLCEALIAENGSIVISSNQGIGTTTPALPPTIVVLAFTSQVLHNWDAAADRLRTLYGQIPSQVVVTHPGSYAFRKGTQKMYLILIEDED